MADIAELRDRTYGTTYQIRVSNVRGKRGDTVVSQAKITVKMGAYPEKPDYHVKIQFYIDNQTTHQMGVVTDHSGMARYNYAIPRNMRAGNHVIRARLGNGSKYADGTLTVTD